MRFFKKSEPTPAKDPVEGWPGSTSQDAPTAERQPLHLSFDLATVDQAKAALAEVKAKKKDLQAEKREVSAELAEVRAEHAERRAGRIVTPRGGGAVGRYARFAVQSKRRNDRMHMQAEVQAYNDQKAVIDAEIRAVDRGIMQIEAYLRENAAAPKTRSAATKAAPVDDVADRLKALGDLRESGLITEDEYNAKRADLIARL